MVATLLTLRPYQKDALAARAEFEAQRAAILLPTGGGKTVCFAHEASRHVKDHPGERVLVLVHTDELVWQAFEKLHNHAPHLKIGIVKGDRRDVYADVIVVSVLSLKAAKRRSEITCVGLIIVDECHHATAKTYMDILTHYGCFGGACRATGYTATLTRGDKKSLGTVWQGVAFSRDISWMVRKGYLVPPKGKAVEVPNLDLRAVKSTRTDYRDGELGTALAESLAPELVAKAYAEHAGGRRGILFAPTVASAYVFAEAMQDQGLKAEVVHGAMPLEERKAVLARHRGGITQVVCNCMILTEGYDDPQVDCIVVARPTKSKGLYIQMVGRGLRVDPAEDYAGQDCLILDVVGASALHDLRSIADLSERAITEKDAHSERSLIALEDEFDAGDGVDAEDTTYWTGEVVTRDFDPLGKASTKVWIKTAEGNFFVPAGTHAYVFIMQYPEPGLWSVAWCTKDSRVRMEPDADGIPRYAYPGGRPVGMTEHRGLPLEEAMVWAEDLAVDLGADTLNTASKKAYWRKKPVSDKMASFARGLGVKLAETRDPVTGLATVTMRAGEVSDLITKIMGSRRIDPLVRKVREAQHG